MFVYPESKRDRAEAEGFKIFIFNLVLLQKFYIRMYTGWSSKNFFFFACQEKNRSLISTNKDCTLNIFSFFLTMPTMCIMFVYAHTLIKDGARVKS